VNLAEEYRVKEAKWVSNAFYDSWVFFVDIDDREMIEGCHVIQLI
jgi:hypothetical protein